MKTGKRVILGLAGGALLLTGTRLSAQVFFGGEIANEDKWRVKCKSEDAVVCVEVSDIGIEGRGENVTLTCINSGKEPKPASSFFVLDDDINGTCVEPCEGASIIIACETPDACHDLYIGEVECTTLDNASGPDGVRQLKQVKDGDGKK